MKNIFKIAAVSFLSLGAVNASAFEADSFELDSMTNSVNCRLQPTIKIGDNGRFDKEIRFDGSFYVDGVKQGQGQWVTETRFIVYVASWNSGLWWVADLTDEGMYTATTPNRSELSTIAPSHLEEYNCF